ncbi:hypothetical protein COU54_00425 [Candidatus Pacearchaeota archaeon CG10_big_fil_rev_8_21_14_0_10_31_24]|nr:MAG: hypothetical protein COU54_00425 [Candidatus Pacearchaeota archaeon CG10_big_fil_rev_8_21_14_0_10_31_24]
MLKLNYSNFSVEIQRVLELEGALSSDFKCATSVYAHISKPEKKDGTDVQYALMAIFPQHRIMHLGDINRDTKFFEHYDSTMRDFALYERADNHVVRKVRVPIEQLNRLRTLDEVLAIEGISIKRELVPSNK